MAGQTIDKENKQGTESLHSSKQICDLGLLLLPNYREEPSYLQLPSCILWPQALLLYPQAKATAQRHGSHKGQAPDTRLVLLSRSLFLFCPD